MSTKKSLNLEMEGKPMKNIIKHLAKLLLLAPFVLAPVTTRAQGAPFCSDTVGSSLSVPAPSPAVGYVIFPNACMYDGDDRTDFVFQPDGNLVVYDFGSGRALWSSRTNGKGGTTLEFQNDGNLVIYHYPTPIWSTQTWGHPFSTLVVQYDGNVVMYDDSSGKPLWATMTNRF